MHEPLWSDAARLEGRGQKLELALSMVSTAGRQHFCFYIISFDATLRLQSSDEVI